MGGRIAKALLALLLPFVLASCVLTPGKFVSTLRIDADRHFAFTYIGEVIALDLGDEFAKGMKEAGSSDKGTDPASSDEDEPGMQKIALQKRSAPGGGKAAPTTASKDASDEKNRAIAAALSKEVGYRKVTYLGDGKFSIDYAISGTLDRAFLWPYNLDAEIVFPFVVLEVRANNTVRIKAPAFAKENDAAKNMAGVGGSGPPKQASQLDGTFTLDTDAEIVSQNNEDGAVTTGARKSVTWKATPTSKDAPSAVLRFR
ncbi:hypothetical protein AB5I39_11610 [Sphingomonas sp. MMS24-J45]|uniref:hypothetical protein n=1 Tax=Sphingomonas sp. MMS24-J45 TaxID=3238806 RepID=UPI003851128C